jgi:hypothetical protein
MLRGANLKSESLTLFSLTMGAALLAGCGGSQPRIGAPATKLGFGRTIASFPLEVTIGVDRDGCQCLPQLRRQADDPQALILR